jgi:PHP family Zn ribbon phosphoesterase
MKDIINDVNVLIENTGYSINKNDVDIEQLKNINGRLKEIRTKLNLLTIPVVVGQSEQLVCDRCGSHKLEECTKDEYTCEDCGHLFITN